MAIVFANMISDAMSVERFVCSKERVDGHPYAILNRICLFGGYGFGTDGIANTRCREDAIPEIFKRAHAAEIEERHFPLLKKIASGFDQFGAFGNWRPLHDREGGINNACRFDERIGFESGIAFRFGQRWYDARRVLAFAELGGGVHWAIGECNAVHEKGRTAKTEALLFRRGANAEACAGPGYRGFEGILAPLSIE